ncbi:MAG: sigma-70 family RNA polymerase sigma factor [Chlorobi bacterium]|nr:sigma-70 family RNA polymerase sigma factor [Chlorobiota bacterium]
MKEADEMIITRVLNGERDAYAVLVDRYKDRVFSLVRGIVKERHVAEEVAQDVFVKAYISLKKFRKESGFSTWLYRIAYNTAVSQTRKKKYLYRSFDEELEMTDSYDAEPGKEVEESRQKLLTRALLELSAEDKLILMLYYFEEKPVEEISRSTALSVSNVKVKLFRIRKKLKIIMERLGKTVPVIY